jgi:hypothetical protein
MTSAGRKRFTSAALVWFAVAVIQTLAGGIVPLLARRVGNAPTP